MSFVSAGIGAATAGRHGHADITESRHARHRSADDIKRHPRTVYHPHVNQAWAHDRVSRVGSPRWRCSAAASLVRRRPIAASSNASSRRFVRRARRSSRSPTLLDAPAARRLHARLAQRLPQGPDRHVRALHRHDRPARHEGVGRALVRARVARRPPAPPVNRAAAGAPPAASEGPSPAAVRGDLSGRAVRSAGADRQRVFPAAPGEYELTVVVREREREDDRGRRRLAAVLRRPLSVPDYSTGALTTSTSCWRIASPCCAEPPPAASLFERPYVIGTREIDPAADAVLRRSEELIVVFLVYNPAVTTDKHFDLEVEYHFFRKSRAGPEDPRPATPAGLTALAWRAVLQSDGAPALQSGDSGAAIRSGVGAAGDGGTGRPARRDFRRGTTGSLIQRHGSGVEAVAGAPGGVHGSVLRRSPDARRAPASAAIGVFQRRQLPWNA